MAAKKTGIRSAAIPGAARYSGDPGAYARRLGLSPSIVSGLVGIADLAVIAALGFVIDILRNGWEGSHYLYATSTAVFAACIVVVFRINGLYRFKTITGGPLSQLWKRIVFLSATVFIALLTVAFSLKLSSEFSRIWAFCFLASSIVAMCAIRAAGRAAIRASADAGHLRRNIAVVGTGEQARRFLSALRRGNEPWNHVVGVFDARQTRLPRDICGYPIIGTINDLIAEIRTDEVDEVVIALPWCAENRLVTLVDMLRELPVRIRIGADLIAFRFQRDALARFGGAPTLDAVPKPMSGWRGALKIFEDKILALIALVVLAPVMVVVAVAIKLDSRGPVLFRQHRYGFNNKIFSIYKFRTMYHERRNETDVPQAKRYDPRVTAVGRILRRLSLDELPQLFNVLNGTMSLIGPRPHAVPHNEFYGSAINGYFARHKVKPGITGWAQVNGLRGETETPDKMRARVAYDLHYIENWSFILDVKILARTALLGVQPTAY